MIIKVLRKFKYMCLSIIGVMKVFLDNIFSLLFWVRVVSKLIYPQFNIDRILSFFISKTNLRVKQHGGLLLNEQIEKYTGKYLTKEQLHDEEYMKLLLIDITKCFVLYSLTVREYFNFELRDKNHEQRKAYLSLELKDNTVIRTLGSDWYRKYLLLKDKNLFYKEASKWFKRDACKIEDKNDYENFEQFARGKSRFIAKPSQGSHGWGTQIINMSDYKTCKEVFDYLLSTKTKWIVEELIAQDTRMKAWNESSVNTLRIPSIQLSDGKFVIFYPYLRMGRKGSIVDNAGSGNPYAAIDAQTGIVCTDGMDEYGHHFTEHPDSKITFKGFQIPDWEEMKKVCQEIHSRVLSEHKYIGFDFAFSEKGWVVVEANWGTFTAQQSLIGKGIKDEFMKLMKS